MVSNKEVIMNVLEDNTYTVHNYKEHYINNNNNGILNEEHLEREQRRLLSESISYLAEELVSSVQHYPEGDISKVELVTDFVVLKRTDFDVIKQLIETLIANDE
jgi:hypothetical protein